MTYTMCYQPPHAVMNSSKVEVSAEMGSSRIKGVWMCVATILPTDITDFLNFQCFLVVETGVTTP